MGTSIFLLFVAMGITFASAAYGFGGVLPIMLATSVAALALSALGHAVMRRAPELAAQVDTELA